MESSRSVNPFLMLQNDWEEALTEDEGRAWVTCKTTGQPGTRGELQSIGLSSEGEPYVTATEGFRINKVSKRYIELQHEDPNCKCTFIAPQCSFKGIHLKSIPCLDVTSGGLGVSVCTNNKLCVWETQKGTIRRELKGHLGDVYTCRFFPSGVVILTGGADMQLKIWSAETGQCPVTLVGHAGAILDTAIVDRGRNIISVSRDGTARLWDCGKSTCLDTLIKTDATINGCCLNSVAFDVDVGIPSRLHNEREIGTAGKVLVLACENKFLRGAAVYSRNEVFAYPTSDAVNCCCFLSSNEVVCGMQNGELALYDLRNTRTHVNNWLYAAAPVNSVLPVKDGFYATLNDGMCVFSSLRSDEIIQLTGPDCDPVYKIVTDNTHFYTCCRDGIIRKYKTII